MLCEATIVVPLFVHQRRPCQAFGSAGLRCRFGGIWEGVEFYAGIVQEEIRRR